MFLRLLGHISIGGQKAVEQRDNAAHVTLCRCIVKQPLSRLRREFVALRQPLQPSRIAIDLPPARDLAIELTLEHAAGKLRPGSEVGHDSQ